MFYAQERIGKTRYKTPEGYLLCVNVPISRCGTFDYSNSEVGIEGDSVVRLTRTAEELFKPEAMASFEGKPVTIGHEEFVSPENYQRVSRGVMTNVRQGSGEQAEMLIADLLIQDAEAIKAIENGTLTELSIGYDASVTPTRFGEGYQVGFVGNHVALVEKARCGSVCTFGDEMKLSWKEKILRAFRDGDEEKLKATLEGKDEEESPEQPAKEEPVMDSAEDAVEARLAKLEEQIASLIASQNKTADESEEEKQEAGDEEEELKDEEPEEQADEAEEPEKVIVADEAEDVFSDAEELAGEELKRPSCDSAKGFSIDALRRVKKQALLKANQRYVKPFGDAKTLSGDALDMAFVGALALSRQAKNPSPKGFGDSKEGVVNSPEAISQLAKQFWNQRN